MRRLLATLLFAAVISAVVSASVLRIGNDTWSMGLSENDDDLLSWSVGYTQDAGNGISVSADIFSFTDRGSGKGEDFHKGRQDIAEICVCWGLDSSDYMDMPVSVSARISGGAALLGNLAGQTAQNMIHRFLGIPEVDLPYPGGLSVYPSASAQAGISWSFNGVASVGAELSGGYTLANPFAGAALKGTFTFHGVDGYVCADYVWRKQGEYRISGLWTANVRGVGIGFGYDFGFMTFSFRLNPATSRGYGVLAFDPLRFFESSWKSTEVCLRLYKAMMTGFIGFNGTDVVWRMNAWFSPSLRFLYSSGYPDRGQAVTDSYRMRHNYGIWMIGGEIRYQFGFVELSAGLHAGISRWCVDRMMNIDPDPGTCNERVASPVCPCASISVGVAIMPDGLVVAGPASVRLYVTGGCMLLTRKAGEALKKDLMHGGWTWHALDPFLGLGVELGF